MIFIFIPYSYFSPVFEKKKGKRKTNRKKRRREKKKEKKKEAGYSTSKMWNNQPSQRFYGVNCSVAQLCRLARRKCLQKVEPSTVQHMAKLFSVLKISYRLIIFLERGFFMYFDVFNTMIFDNENDLMSCIEDDYIRAAMTLDEIAKIVPRAQKIMDAQTFDEILVESDYLIDDLPLPVGDLERWEKHGLTDFEKYCVAFLYAAMQMEHDRYRICRKCGRAYFSTNEFSEYCDECEDRYSHV